MNIHAGFSDNGIDWKINPQPIEMKLSTALNSYTEKNKQAILHSDYKYDPRVVFIDDRYWIIWCNGYHGPTIAV